MDATEVVEETEAVLAATTAAVVVYNSSQRQFKFRSRLSSRASKRTVVEEPGGTSSASRLLVLAHAVWSPSLVYASSH